MIDADIDKEARQREAVEKERAKRHELFLESVRRLSKDEGFSDILWEVLSFCRLYDTAQLSNDQSQYRDGQRSVGRLILSMLGDADPAIYPKLILKKLEDSTYA